MRQSNNRDEDKTRLMYCLCDFHTKAGYVGGKKAVRWNELTEAIKGLLQASFLSSRSFP